jgi:hypothetical protein
LSEHTDLDGNGGLRVLAALDHLKSADSPGATASERECAAFWLFSAKEISDV